MADPLQAVLLAEATAHQRVEQAKQALEDRLHATRLEAQRIRARNEQRTRAALQAAEAFCVARTMREIDAMDEEVTRQLKLDDHIVAERIDRLAMDCVDRIWPD